MVRVLPYDSHNVYAYFYYWQGEKRLQTAWTRWEFGSRILDICSTGQEVWFVFQHGDEVFLEKMAFTPNTLHLDHQVALEPGTYDATFERTHWTMPHDGASISIQAWNLATQEEIPLLTHDQTELQGRGDLSDAQVVAGLPYSMRLTLGPLVVRNESSTGMVGLPYPQITARQIRFGIENIKGISAHVSVRGHLQTPYHYSGNATGGSTTGASTFTVPLHGKAEELTVTLINDEVRNGGVLANAIWTGTYGDA